MEKRPEDAKFSREPELAQPGSKDSQPSDALQLDGNLRLMIRRLPQSALLLDSHRIIESNPCAEFVLGRERSELVGRPWTAIFSERQSDGQASAVILREMIQASLGGRNAAPRRWCFRRSDGSTIEEEISIAAVEAGNQPLAIALIRDPSEWRQTELPSGDSFRWEQLGKLSWGIAHDFNNMLTAIDGSLDNALAEGASEAVRLQGLTVARSCTHRAARLNRRLLDLSRGTRFKPKTIAIDELLDETVRGLAPILGPDIEVVFEPDAGALALSGDREQIEQAILNLAMNARDAMPAGGRLTLSTSEQVVDAEFVRRRPWAKLGVYVRIDVRDTGIGIPYDLQPRVFEPFFTSKVEGPGIGLGLSIVYGVVKQHRGFIDLDSRPGEGTRFWMMFPARLPPGSASSVHRSAVALGADGAAILVIDDEEIVRNLAVTALRAEGHRVLEASSAEEAEARFIEELGSIDVVVTDLMLGGVGGHELAQRFKAKKPELHVVYTTGCDISQLADDVRPDEADEFLQKPYTLRALADSVQRLLDER